ncbi:membrane-anchored ubiquitin-fold protein [Trifolium repens]|nr:membrane-anchored ubiquitin-fold protein [Trifolium repens]
MAEGEEPHDTYPASTTTVATLKQKLNAEWPQGKTVVPKSINDVRFIHTGKVLENTKTLADSKITFSDIPGAITMHVIVQPPIAKKKTGLFNLLIYAFAEVVWLRVPLVGEVKEWTFVQAKSEIVHKVCDIVKKQLVVPDDSNATGESKFTNTSEG